MSVFVDGLLWCDRQHCKMECHMATQIYHGFPYPGYKTCQTNVSQLPGNSPILGPLLKEKKNLLGHGLAKVENHWAKPYMVMPDVCIHCCMEVEFQSLTRNTRPKIATRWKF